MPGERKLNLVQADFHMHWGGQAEVVLSLSKSLSSMGQNVTVISPPGSALEKRASEEGLQTFDGCRFRKGMRLFALYRDVSNLGPFLRDKAIDIYHCHGSQDHWAGALAVKQFEGPTQIVRSRHNIFPVKNHFFNRWLFQQRTAQVITTFGEQSRFFTETGLLKDEQIVTIHAPLPPDFVDPPNLSRAIRKELNLADNVPLVGFGAAFHPDKAPLNFIAAAKIISEKMPNVQFAMAGFGPLDKTIDTEIKASGLGSRVHVVGFRKDMLGLMSSFDIFVLSSITREASSTVLKEAGALGIPAVATNVGGTREIVEHEKTGLLVPPGDVPALADAILKLLHNPERARAMGQAGKTKVLAEFTAQAIAARTLDVYRKILQAREPAGVAR